MNKLQYLSLIIIMMAWFAGLAGAANHAPVILAGPAADPPQTLQYNPGVRLSAVAADPDGDPVTYTWDLGDGRRLRGAAVDAWWNTKTSYTVTLTVSDGKGASTTSTLPMFVGDSLYMSRPVTYPYQPDGWTTGTKKVLVIPVNLADKSILSNTVSTMIANMASVRQFYQTMSYGRLDLVTTVTPIINLPTMTTDYPNGGASGHLIMRDARNAARALGFDTDQYDLDIIVSPLNWTAGTNSMKGCQINGAGGVSWGVTAHEVGHDLGMRHASLWRPLSKENPIGPGAYINYGNMFDNMATCPNLMTLHWNAYAKNRLHWIPDANVTAVTTSGVYRITAFDQTPFNAASAYALKIKKDVRDYWVDFRQAITTNPFLMNGVCLKWTPFGLTRGCGTLIDMNPQTADALTSYTTSDCPLSIGRTFADSEAGIFITPLQKNGTTPESIDVAVNFGPFPNNHPPTLTIGADASSVPVNTFIHFTATAGDPDGDTLAYIWDFGDGSYGPHVAAPAKSWTKPGEYSVRCTVSDLKGGSVTKSMVVTIGSPTTYRISGTVTKAGQPLAGVRVSVGTTTQTFTDSDGLYTLTGLAAGSYTVSASLFDHTLTRAGFSNPVAVGPSATGKDFTAAYSNNNAPTIAALPDITMDENTLSTTYPLTIGDVETAAGSLMVSPSVASPALVDPNNIITGGSGANQYFTIEPNPNQFGTTTVTLTASDGGRATSRSFLLTVRKVNNAPQAAGDAYAMKGDLYVAAPGVLANDRDVDGDPLTAVLVAPPLNGTLTLQPDGSFLYRPRQGFVGVDTFAYSAKDASATSIPSAVVITVHPPANAIGKWGNYK